MDPEFFARSALLSFCIFAPMWLVKKSVGARLALSAALLAVTLGAREASALTAIGLAVGAMVTVYLVRARAVG